MNEWESYFDHEDGEANVECERCGADELHWEATELYGYRLYESDGARHVCQPDAEGF